MPAYREAEGRSFFLLLIFRRMGIVIYIGIATQPIAHSGVRGGGGPVAASSSSPSRRSHVHATFPGIYGYRGRENRHMSSGRVKRVLMAATCLVPAFETPRPCWDVWHLAAVFVIEAGIL